MQGGWTIKRRTQGKRQRRFMSGLGEWCRRHCHEAIYRQYRRLSAKLRGHYQYYGVRGNYPMLESVYEHARRVWRQWLNRRNSKDLMTWEDYAATVARWYPLPKPRIVHAY